MPEPEEVKPGNFDLQRVLFKGYGFSMAWGEWEDGSLRLAMRWDGEGADPGYPKLFKNPVWFILPEELALPLVRALIGLPGAKEGEILSTIPEIPRPKKKAKGQGT